MKKQTIFLKLMALTLALLMLAALVAGCTKQGETEETGENPQGGATTETGRATDADGFYLDDLPADLNFGRTFHILGEQIYKQQYYGLEVSPNDMVLSTIYKRNETVQERLGVEFQWTFKEGDWGTREGFIKEVETGVKGGGTSFDATICYNLVPQVIAERGMAANLYGSKYLDLTGPWWPSVYVDEMVVNDTIYGLVESNDFGMLQNMMAMFFNNEMLEAKGIESPYELVEKNEWTIAKFKELIKDTYGDTNGNSKVDPNDDTFGYCTATQSKMDAWVYGLGYKYSEVVNDEIISNVNASYPLSLIDTMVDLLSTDDTYAFDTSQHKMFLEERVYFYCAAIMLAPHIKRLDLDINYGVAPMPKMNSQQEKYYTHLSNTHDAWCVPVSVSDLDCTSAVMECMASEAYRSIGPTYYDTYVKLRYAPDARLAKMYDLVRDSVTFDFVYLYSCVYTNNPKDLVKNCFLNPENQQWSSVYSTNEQKLDEAFARIAALYNK